ncbi:MAG TPA: GspMb/PilO family protein [Gemmatimonadaceae bacterium]|nr:GspMb/PilO family protein [Gemmatimonadaceae bacterium]
MGTPQLGVRDRRVLSVGALTISLLVGLSRGLPALRAWERARMTEARTVALQLAELRNGVESLPLMRESLVVRRARLAAIDSLLPAGASPSAVAAAIASILEQSADDNAVKLTNLQLRADSTVRVGLVRVSVRLSGVTDVSGLAGLLRSIEAGETPLVVRDLSVSQPEPAAPDSRPEALRFDVLVAGIGRISPNTRGTRE